MARAFQNTLHSLKQQQRVARQTAATAKHATALLGKRQRPLTSNAGAAGGPHRRPIPAAQARSEQQWGTTRTFKDLAESQQRSLFAQYMQDSRGGGQAVRVCASGQLNGNMTQPVLIDDTRRLLSCLSTEKMERDDD